MVEKNVLLENLRQEGRTFSYYKVDNLKDRNGDDWENIAIKVIAEELDSDPDVYISKTNAYPSSSHDSDWHCIREGSETCIIGASEIDEGDPVYFGIFCSRDCSYKLKVYESATTVLAESQEPFFDGFSTQVLKYFIKDEEATKSILIKVEPENFYSPIEMWLSLDEDFYLIEEQPASHVL